MTSSDSHSGFLAAETDAVLAAQVLAGAEDSAVAWHRLGLALALAGRGAELLDLADRAASRFGDSLIFFHNVVKDLALRGAWHEVRVLAETLPPARRDHAVALYYAGCAEVAGGRHEAALQWFSRFKQAVLARHEQFPLGEPAFNLIFRQGCLVEEAGMVRELAAQPVPTTQAVEFLGELVDLPSAFVVAHVVDARYFRRFAAELCAGHQEFGLAAPLHFHVAASDNHIPEEMATLRAKFPGLALGFSHEAPGLWDHPVYYTCARFHILNKLIDRYGRPVMTVDADIVPIVAVRDIFQAAAGSDFACFETGRTEPASVYQASIMVFGTGARSRAFVDDLVRFTVAKLSLPPALSWMLDQAAIYSVLTQRLADDPEFRFRALDVVIGCRLEDAIRQLSNDEEKLAIMSRSADPG